MHERTLLEHDARIFELLLFNKFCKSASFTNDSDRAVRIYVVDQTLIETVLGIDLIIYNTCYENFLLLQYKRMINNGDGWHYHVNPSSNLHTQLSSMATFCSAVSSELTSAPTLWSYRLNDEPFYFKFCEQFRPSARDESLIPGITLCKPHLSEFLTLPEAKGPNGGTSIGYYNCPRYLNNTEFVQLARMGWIGAGSQASALLRKVLEANAIDGRSAMLAVLDVPKKKSASGRGRKK